MQIAVVVAAAVAAQKADMNSFVATARMAVVATITTISKERAGAMTIILAPAHCSQKGNKSQFISCLTNREVIEFSAYETGGLPSTWGADMKVVINHIKKLAH
jgi:hypothetical protein